MHIVDKVQWLLPPVPAVLLLLIEWCKRRERQRGGRERERGEERGRERERCVINFSFLDSTTQ